jgi:hypothetical protein
MVQKIAVTSGTLLSNRGKRWFAVAGTLYLLEGCGLLEGDTGPWRRLLRRGLGKKSFFRDWRSLSSKNADFETLL